jgi:hypothetical protein
MTHPNNTPLIIADRGAAATATAIHPKGQIPFHVMHPMSNLPRILWQPGGAHKTAHQ